eukprot:gene14703-20743_t
MLTRRPTLPIARSPRLVHASPAIGLRPAYRLIRQAAADVESVAPVEAESVWTPEDEKRAFPEALPKDGLQGALTSLPLPIFYAALAAVVGASAFAGSLAGRGVASEASGNRDAAAALAAVVFGSAAAAACVPVKKLRDGGAVVDLYNQIVLLPDPSFLSEETVSAVGSNYGINMQEKELDGLQRVYSQYLEYLIPVEENQLRGDEADKLIAFKNALGLPDEDAAPVHVDLGRRLYRQKDETKDRFQQFEQRKAFQRLVYVSHLVFGEQKASFLLPWRRIFKLTDSHLYVARRDNAKIIFRAHLEQLGGYIPADRVFLHELREYQLAVKVMDESVKLFIEEYMCKHVEGRLEKCLEVVKMAGKNKDIAGLCEETPIASGQAPLNPPLPTNPGKNKDIAGLCEETPIASGQAPLNPPLPTDPGKNKDIAGLCEETPIASGQAPLNPPLPTYPGKIKDIAGLCEETPIASGQAPLNPPLPTYLGKNKDIAGLCEETPIASGQAPLNPPLPTYLGKNKDIAGLCEETPIASGQAPLNPPLPTYPGKNKDIAGLCEEVRHILDYSHKLVALADEEGLAYLGEQLDLLGEFPDKLEAELKELQKIMCISSADAARLREEMSGRLYKKLLKEVVVSRKIDEAGNPAVILEGLVKKAKFSSEASTELHLELYKQKLTTLLSQKKQFNAADSSDLDRMRKMLCLTPEIVIRAQRDTVGKELKEVLGDIFRAGAKAVTGEELAKMDAVVKNLQIDSVVVQENLQQATIEKFRTFVAETVKPGQDRKTAPLIMKRMLKFNSLVVTPLLAHAKSYAGEAPAADVAAEESAGQVELTLKNEVDTNVRSSLYKKYLMYYMSAEAKLPVGQEKLEDGSSVREAELKRLSLLGVLLGMDETDIGAVHRSASEDVYKDEVKDIMRAGQLTDRSDYLEDLRSQLDIPSGVVDKLQKEVRDDISGSGGMTEDSAKWTLERVTKLHETGGNVENVMEETSRRNLFRKELERGISDGTGELQSEYILEKLPRVLVLDKRKVAMVLKELVGSRRRVLLVQAISQLRQKQRAAVVVSLNNLISCNRALPETETVPWTEPQELKDLFQAYCLQVEDASKRSVLQALFGYSDEQALDLLTASKSPTGLQAVVQEDEDSIF